MEETMKLSYQARNGHQRDNVVHKGTNSRATARRKRALERLEDQLKKGTKTVKDTEVLLTAHDIKRIKQEILTLKSRV